MKESVHVMLASDAATAAGLAVAGYSAIKRTSRPVTLWVVQKHLDSETIRLLRAFWRDAEKVQFLTMQSLPWWWAPPTLPLLTWARIQVAELLPSSVSRCIYLDTDTLVGRDLSELFDAPLCGNLVSLAINAVAPVDISYVKSN